MIIRLNCKVKELQQMISIAWDYAKVNQLDLIDMS